MSLHPGRLGFMSMRRHTVTVSLAALLFSTGVIAQKKVEKKQDEAQKKEIQSVVKVVDDVANGQPAPNDLSLSWVRQDYLKAQGNKEYVPFTVAIDPSKVGGGNVALYWRVVSAGAAATEPEAAATGKKDEKKDDKKDKDKKSDYAY